MNTNFRFALRLTAAASTAGVLMALPTQAQTESGPALDATRNLTINAATTFNNSYGTSFEATGDLTGTAAFADASPGPQNLNSGTAFLSAMVSFEGGSAGVLAGVSGLSQTVFDGGQPIVRDNSSITFDHDKPVALGVVNPRHIVIKGAGPSSTVGGSFIGTNIGTEVLQVGGSLNEVIVNELQGF